MEANITINELTKTNIAEFIKMNNVSYDTDSDIKTILSDKEFYKSAGIKNGIIYNFDSVKYGDIEKLKIDFDNIIEARFFSESIEIDIKICDGSVTGSIFIDNGEKELVINESFYLIKNKENDYNKLEIKKYIDFDEDKQAYVFYMKPCKFLKEV